MILLDATINDNALADVSPAIVVYDIAETASETENSIPFAMGNGSRFLRQQRTGLAVTLQFAIREQDVAQRMAIYAAVQEWATGGNLLSRNDRAGQLLTIDNVSIPGMPSALKWTDILAVTFHAYSDPYWRSQETVSTTITDRGSLTVPGTAPECKASAVITPTGELTTVTIDTGLSRITLDELTHSQPISIGHDANGYLSISSAGQSLLLHRTIDSSDELLVACGTNAISVTANVPVSVEISARGAWL